MNNPYHLFDNYENFLLQALPQYWPENDDKKFDNGNIVIQLKQCENLGRDIRRRTFFASDKLVL